MPRCETASALCIGEDHPSILDRASGARIGRTCDYSPMTYGPPPPPAAPPGPPRPTAKSLDRASALGVAALVTAALFFIPFLFVVSIVLVMLALARANGDRRVVTMAVVALIIDVALVGIYVAVVPGLVRGAIDRGLPEWGSSDGPLAWPMVNDLEVGDCLNDDRLAGLEVGEMAEGSRPVVVSCDNDHQFEVYADTDLPDGDYPGQRATEREALELCTREFESYVGIPGRRSQLSISYYFPIESSWEAGDRALTCLLSEPDYRSDSSLRDSRR